VLAQFHDAELRKIVNNTDKRCIELYFKKSNEEFASIYIDNPIICRVVDFSLQNIVFRLIIDGCNSKFNSEELIWRVKWIAINCNRDNLLDYSAIDRIVTRLNIGELHLLIIESSWGAELAVIAESITGLGLVGLSIPGVTPCPDTLT
jgi:hypothetical protein